MVCIAPRHGLFFRINSEDHWLGSVPIDAARHAFLGHDSYIECHRPLEFDDDAMDEAAAEGILGSVRRDVVQAIWAEVRGSTLISPQDKQAIRNALQIP